MTSTLRRLLTGILPGIALLLGTSALRADTLFYWDILNSAQGAAPYSIAGSATGGSWGTGSGITNNSSTKVAATGNTVTAASGKDMGTSITNGAYFSFSIKADANYNLTLTNLGTTMMSAQSAGTTGSGPYKVALLYSTNSSWGANFTNGTYTDISGGGSGTVSLTASAANVSAGLGGTYLGTNNVTISAGNTLYFALVYMMSSNNSSSSYTTWYSTNSSSNDFSILGTATALAVSKNLIWGGGNGTWGAGDGGWLSNGVASTWSGIDTATITNNTSPTLTVSNSTAAGSLTVSNTSGTVALTGGSLALSGALNKSGAGSFTSGTGLSVAGAFTNAAGDTVLNGSNSFTGAVAVTGGSVTANSNNTFLSTVTVNGGSLTLNASNAITAAVTVGNGSLTLGNSKAIGSGNALTVNDAGAVNLGGNSVTVGAVTVGSATISNGSLTSSSVYSLTNGSSVGASLAGSASVTLAGANATLSGTNTYSGTTAFKGTGVQTLNIASTSALSGNSGLSGLSGTNVAVLNLQSTGNYIGSYINGGGPGGNLTFSSTNALGLTSLELTNTGALNNIAEGNERTLTANNVNLIIDGSVDLNNLKTKTPTEHLAGNGNFDFKGDITSQNNSANVINTLVLNGTGTVTLRGNNTGLNGTVYGFSGSTLAVSGATNLVNASNLTLGGKLVYSGSGDTFTNALTLGSSTNTGSIANVAIVQNGTGTVALTGAGSANAAQRTVTLAGSTAGVGSISGAITDGSYTSTTVATTFSGSTTVSFSTNVNIYNIGVGATVTGAGIDAGTTVVAVDYANTNIVLNKATTANILAGATLNFGGSTALTKNGTGAWNLAGANTYSGATTIDAGLLSVNGSLKSDGTVTVNSGGTLGGSGSVGNVTVNSGGTLAPGNSPGTLSVASLTLNSGATTAIQLVSTNAGGFDSINILSGNLTYGGTLNFDIISYTPTAGDLFTVFNMTGGGVISGDFNTVMVGSLLLTDASGVWTGIDNVNNVSYTFTDSTGVLAVTTVPEPGTCAMAAIGLGALTFMVARRRANRSE